MSIHMSMRKISKELKERFNGRHVLFAEDIAELIGSDHRVVKCLRTGLSIPLPTIKTGRKHGIELKDVAEWIASRNASSASVHSNVVANKRLQSPARQRASLGRSLLGLRTHLEALNAHQIFLEELIFELLHLQHEAELLLEERYVHERSSLSEKP